SPIFFESGYIEQVADELVQSLDVFQHVLEEDFLLGGTDLSSIERLQIQLQRGDGTFQLVRYAIDEVRLPPTEIDGLDRKRQIPARADDAEHQERGPDRKHRNVEAGPLRIVEEAEHAEQHPAHDQRHEHDEHHDA